MNDCVKREIMEQSRHQFIYAYNCEERMKFLKKLEIDYPIQIDSNIPMGIYLDKFGLPKISQNSKLDYFKVDVIAEEYLCFSIIYNILIKSVEHIDIELLNKRIVKILASLNKISKNPNYQSINCFDDLISVVNKSREFYYEYYNDYIKNGEENMLIDDLVLPFINLDMFILEYKEAINNNSYFGIIIDKQHDISISSTRAINSLVGSRINSDISMKIVTAPDDWDTYYGLNGQLVENVHDYGSVELDNSYSEYTKRLKKNLII